MTHDQVQQWLDDYIAAWRSGEASDIGRLFTDDAIYGFRPWDSDKTTVTGRDAIVASWLDDPDDPSGWEAAYAPYAVDGDRAVGVGWSRYAASDDHPERLYHNAFLLRFGDEGRCAEFHEFYVLEKR